MIKIEIDKLGQITEQIDQVRQGDKGVVVQATFEDKDNINYVAKINLTRNDGEMATGLIMQPDAEHSDTFVRTLESEWYFCKQGPTSLTVYLYKSGVVDAQGQVNFNVEETDYDGEPTITPDELAGIYEAIATKLNIVNGIVKINTYSAVNFSTEYAVGQVFYVASNENYDNHRTLIRKIDAQGNTELIFDFDAQVSGKISDVEVEQEITATQITNTVKLLNSVGEEVASFEIELPSALITKAGLMSASDKVKLNGLPTGAEIAQQHTNLHNEVVAEKTRAEGVEAQKENLSNKKTVINDSTANHTNYASVKAVKDFVNDAINNVSAYYITKNANGDAFESVEELEDATTFYSGGQVRTPTRNDYCIVRTDENHANATTRYIYQGSQWEFQYIVNEEPLTDAQLQAIGSGITSAKVSAYDTHIADTNKHIQSGERAKWDGVVNKQIKNKTFDHIPQANELEEGQVGIVPSIEDLDSETIIGYGLEVITNAQTGVKTLQAKKLYKHLVISNYLGVYRLLIITTRSEAYTSTQDIANDILNIKKSYIVDGQQPWFPSDFIYDASINCQSIYDGQLFIVFNVPNGSTIAQENISFAGTVVDDVTEF